MVIALSISLRHTWSGRFRCVGLLLGCLLTAGAFGQAPLALPFFDDFSTTSSRLGLDVPDPARWEPGSGVYLNNTIAVNQPTVGVASFDGLRANGRIYQQTNLFLPGYTDTLQSRPISLAGLSQADSVYLSFYWQSSGLGALPDPGDSLTLQFRDRAGVWRTVWQVENAGDSLKTRFIDGNGLPQTSRQLNGSDARNTFFQAFVPVAAPNFLHAGFAFRFRAIGNESGPFDVWNLDYVYLDKGRSRSQTAVKDAAARQALSPFLKRYTAMPLTQYAANPAAETADTIFTDITNLNNVFNSLPYRFTVRDEVSGRVVQNDPESNPDLVDPLSSQRKRIRPNPVTDLGAASRAVLRYSFDLRTTDNQGSSIPGIDLRQNDTVSGTAVLDDYYAYDDGTWEVGLESVGARGQVAVRFVLNKPDVVTGVRACIVPFRTNQTGQPFILSVYSNRNGQPGPAIYQKSFTIQYPTTRNGFVTFAFDRGVSVRDTFYVGFQQINASDTTRLRLGFDKNSPFGNQIFYNGGTSWSQNLQTPALNLPGAFMLRPVMRGMANTVVTALPEPTLNTLQVYPNPTTGLIRWDDKQVIRLEVMDAAGRLRQVVEPSQGQQTLDLSHLPNGLYLIRLNDRHRTVVQKILVQH